MIKIIFFDIDGTLIDINATDMTEKTKLALRQLKQNNILVFAATGRPPYIIPKFEGVSFDGVLAFNGQLCIFQDKIIYSNPLNKKDVYQIIENAKSMDKACMAASSDRMGANFYDKELDDYMLIASKDGAKVLSDYNDLLKQDIYQMMISIQRNQENLILDKTHCTKITRWHPDSADIIPLYGGKGIGIKKTLEYLNIDIDESMAFGDGGNDIDMLERVGCGIAMGNALDSVKKIANYTTKAVSEDGVYWALKHFNLI